MSTNTTSPHATDLRSPSVRAPFGVRTNQTTRLRPHGPVVRRGVELLTLLLLAVRPAVSAADFQYTTNADGTIAIAGYTGPGGAVTIPDLVGALPVTRINNAAFQSNSVLTSVEIGNRVTYIGMSAFLRCVNLTNVTFGQAVGLIDFRAFWDCPSLTRLTFPDSVTNIGMNAFFKCSSLTNVTIGKNVAAIEIFAFGLCDSLQGAYFRGDAPKTMYSGSMEDATVLYHLPGTQGWDTFRTACPKVLWNPRVTMSDARFGVRDNQFGFTLSGTDNLTVRVQACTNLDRPVWLDLGTATLTGGSAYFSDPDWSRSPSRYYRLTTP